MSDVINDRKGDLMLKNAIDIAGQYISFIESVAQSKRVFTLMGEGESALSTSLHFLD
ncbi:hypothetical protein [Pelistega indica]|nr:hypothetical protein [Pelistega indica]